MCNGNRKMHTHNNHKEIFVWTDQGSKYPFLLEKQRSFRRILSWKSRSVSSLLDGKYSDENCSLSLDLDIPVTQLPVCADSENSLCRLVSIKSNNCLNAHIPSNKLVKTPFEHYISILESSVLQYINDPGRLYGKPAHARNNPITLPRSEFEQVVLQYTALRNVCIPDKLASALCSNSFNNWMYSDAQLLTFVRHMFLGLNLPETCKFSVNTLETWLMAVYLCYNDVPFHNFKHSFVVTQMVYSLIKQVRLDLCFEPLDLFVLMFSAVSHDLGHPGFTNSYQINVGSWLAIRYNDRSPLENHHCATAFGLIGQSSTNVASGLTPEEWKWFRAAVAKCILSTDMAVHCDQLNKLQQYRSQFAELTTSNEPQRFNNLRELFKTDADLRLLVMSLLIKICDVSNELRPIAVADTWLDRLMEEFFYQSDVEKQAGLPVASFMDPDKVVRASSQVYFLQTTLIPMLNIARNIFPEFKILEDLALERVAYYQLLEKQQQDEPSGLDQSLPDQVTFAPTALQSFLTTDHTSKDSPTSNFMQISRKLQRNPP